MSEMQLQDSDIKRLVKEHWDDRALTFDDVAHHGIHSQEQREAWQEVLRHLCSKQGLRILDIGCGTGFLSLLLAEMGNEVDGMDIAPSMLERARAKAKETGLAAQFFEGDAEALQMADASYDLVVERHVIWTLPHPDAALRDWRRVLRPGGVVGLIEGAFGRREQVQPGYEQIHQALPLYRGSPSPLLAEMLTVAGFESVTVEPLMDSNLWGEDVDHERYVVKAVRA